MTVHGRRRVCGTLVLLGCLIAPLLAHNISAIYLDLTIDDRKVTVRYRLFVPEMDLMFHIDDNLDGRYDRAEIQRALKPIQDYVDQKLTLQIDARRVLFAPRDFELWREDKDHLFVDFVSDVPVDEPVKRIQIDSRFFQEIISSYKTMVTIRAGENTSEFALDTSSRGAEWQPGQTAGLKHFIRFLTLGMEHIFTGYDHILFLIGLLLLESTLLEVVKIVTAFTVAHSLTLALAVLGQVNPNPTLIEVGIAFSIAYVGMENLMHRRLIRRWNITFFFGLVHGFGFAHVLRDMNLTSRQLASSLFSFNLGVEVGQMAIVALVFPLLKSTRHWTWHPVMLKAGSATVLAFGVFWFFERLFVS